MDFLNPHPQTNKKIFIYFFLSTRKCMTITMSGIQFLMSVKVVYKCQKVTRLINFSVIMNWKKVISEHIHYGDITKGTGPINILCL